ncbi:hypothetical protein AVEN_169324-1 [Araneus ventricosus]|uniref:Uncharacterized protein n=1 Tax=Araneus ventricosus TaxID=182803 RepID=A0A4Y2P226_ARAVE|nr:hypothetical protein AVEN_169324-1 [Araneus ventricosus]
MHSVAGMKKRQENRRTKKCRGVRTGNMYQQRRAEERRTKIRLVSETCSTIDEREVAYLSLELTANALIKGGVLVAALASLDSSLIASTICHDKSKCNSKLTCYLGGFACLHRICADRHVHN